MNFQTHKPSIENIDFYVEQNSELNFIFAALQKHNVCFICDKSTLIPNQKLLIFYPCRHQCHKKCYLKNQDIHHPTKPTKCTHPIHNQ